MQIKTIITYPKDAENTNLNTVVNRIKKANDDLAEIKILKAVESGDKFILNTNVLVNELEDADLQLYSLVEQHNGSYVYDDYDA